MEKNFDFEHVDVHTLNLETIESIYHQIKSNVYLLGKFLERSSDPSIHLPPRLNELALTLGQKTKNFQEDLRLHKQINKDELIDISTSLLGYSQMIRDHINSARPKNTLPKEINTTYKVLDLFEEKIYSAFQPPERMNGYTSVSTMLDYLNSPLRQEKIGNDSSIQLENTDVLLQVPEQEVKIVLDNLVNNIYDYASGGATISGQEQEDFYFLSIVNPILDESKLRTEVKEKRTGKGLNENKSLLEQYGGHFTTSKNTSVDDYGFDLFVVNAFFPLYKEKNEQQERIERKEGDK